MKREDFYRLLYYGLLEIRASSDPESQPIAYRLSGLLHNLPLKLEKHEGELSSSDVEVLLDELRRDAERIGVAKWLESQIK